MKFDYSSTIVLQQSETVRLVAVATSHDVITDWNFETQTK
jgi:hypothetical protein